MTTRSLRNTAISGLLAALLLAACGGEKPEALLASAKDYLAKNDSKAAVIQIKNALQQAPDLAEARFLLGKALLDGGDAVAAEVELRKAMELKHDPEQVAPPLARAMLARGQAQKVVDEFGNVELASLASKAELLTVLSAAHATLGNAEAAKVALASALEAKPDHAPALLLQARIKAGERDLEGALAVVESAIAKVPADPEAWKLKGDLLLAQNKSDDAMGAFRKALELRPNYLPAHAAIVGDLLRQAKLDEAGKQLAEMRKVAAKHPQTLFLAAQLSYSQKDFKGARDSLQELHKSASPTPLSLQLSGAVEYRLGAYGAAEDNLARAMQAAPNLGATRRLLIATYLRTGQVNKAIGALQPVLGKIDNSPAMLALAGEVFMQSGDLNKAEEYYAKATKLDPKDSTKRTRLALTHMAAGKVEGAFDELQDISAEDTGTTADLALVSAHLRRGELDKALQAIDVLEKKQPDNPAVYHVRGQALLAKKDIPGARKNFEKAQSVRPAFFPAAASLAGLDLAEKKPDEAKRRFESVLAADPKSMPALLALAELHAKTGGKLDEVASLIGKAIVANPNDHIPRLALVGAYLGGKDPKKAVVAAQEAMTVLPDKVEIVDALGRAQLAAGDNNQAMITFNKLSTMQPNSPLPYLRVAEVHVASKDKGEAIRSLRKGLEVQPDYQEGQRALIMLYIDTGKYSDATAVARDVQRQRPRDSIGYAFEGDIAIARKAWPDAIKAYRTALERGPATDLAIKLNRVIAAGGSKQEADKQAAAWLKEHPKDLTFRMYVAEVATAKQDWAGAAENYRVLLESQPNNALVLNNLAWAAGQAKDPKALEYAEKANKLAPDQPAVMDTLAMLLLDKGDTARASELLTKAVELGPNLPAVRLNLAKLLVKTGKKAEARKHLDELVKLGDKFNGQAEVARLLKEI